MQGLKVSLIFAAFGFLLSLLFGLSSHSGIWILIHALIFALIFGVLGFLVSFLSEKFLFDDSDSELSVESPASVSASPVGTKVDLYVRDEELADEGNGNSYYVDDSSYQMLNPSDAGKNSKAADFSVAGTGSVAAVKNDVESLQTGGAKDDSLPPKTDVKMQMAAQNARAAAPAPSENNSQKSQAEEAEQPQKKTEASSQKENSLDTLPDMTSFVMESPSQKSDDEGEAVESDTGFSSSVTASHKDPAELAGQSAEVMAKAISSVLSAESES